MITITPSVLAEIRAHASSAYPEECCGLLLAAAAVGTWTDPAGPSLEIVEAIPAQNLAHANRVCRFQLDPLAYLHAERQARQRGLEVVGCYHSHPDHPALPSASDASLAWDNFCYIILPTTATATGAPRAWRFHNQSPSEVPMME